MAVATKDVKILWSKAAGRCSMPDCRAELIADSSAARHPPNTLIGDTCHIVARKPDGPRRASLLSEADRHHYSNLILLCRNHHAIVDQDPEAWPVELCTKSRRTTNCGWRPNYASLPNPCPTIATPGSSSKRPNNSASTHGTAFATTQCAASYSTNSSKDQEYSEPSFDSSGPRRSLNLKTLYKMLLAAFPSSSTTSSPGRNHSKARPYGQKIRIGSARYGRNLSTASTLTNPYGGNGNLWAICAMSLSPSINMPTLSGNTLKATILSPREDSPSSTRWA